MRFSLPCLAAAALIGLAAPAQAGITFDFLENGTGGFGNTQTFRSKDSATYTVLATGVGADLFVKTSGLNETGLGLKGTDDNEITKTTSVVLDFHALKAQIGAAKITFTIGSVQKNEGYELFANDGTNHLLTSAVATNNLNAPLSFTVDAATVAKYDKFVVTAFGPASDSNVVLESATVNAVPEPASLALTGLGFLGAVAGYRLRRSAKLA